MAANRTQLQNALHKPYDRVLFSREVLSPVFGSGFTLNSSLVPASVTPNDSELVVINKVWIYGKIQLDDGTKITCYEILLQPNVRIEQSKVAIQQYVRKLLTAGEAALINFVAHANKNVWRLTLVAKDSVLTDKGVKEKTTNAKRYTFLLGPSETCKTAAERFEVLSTEKEITFQTLINAFSVEKLSKAFFDEYTLHYQNFCDYLQESNYSKSVFNINFPAGATKQEKDKTSKPIRDFVKKLLGRIVFLYFVQKKGWLGASDTHYTDGMPDFIKQLFHQSGGNDTFYSNWLTVLFFDTLNKERANDDFKMPDGKTVKVPFLNGGLFDKEAFDESLLTFPAKLFHNPNFEDIILTAKSSGNARGFLDFLDAFNFTVYEDSPDDHTVAVDPEMLGHIFENLLEDNKDKGAFYTPKEIVHYMCQESLIEYLKNSPPVEGCPKDGVVDYPEGGWQSQPDGAVKRASKNYFELPYNPNLKEKARELRKAGNLPEVLFWNRVKNKQLKGFDFDRQKIIGNYIVDFYCTNCNVVIEIDGSSHDGKAEYDAERDRYLESLGLTVIHIPVEDVMKNLDRVMEMLFNHPALKGTPPQEGNLWGEKIALLIKYKDASCFSEPEIKLISEKIDNVKICDPAIGSGAFPMGLLQEIFSIKELIAYKTGNEWKPAETKLNIIQNSIYGVDIEKGAVDIARLRFWLSLVVDEEKPKPLPNLDYKIVVGDSLISKFDGEIVEIDWEIKENTQTDMFGNENLQQRKKLLQTLTDKQRKYFDPKNKNKKELALEIRNHKIDVLINQLELMVKTKGLEQVPVKTNYKDNKKFVAAQELYLKTQGWLKTIGKLKHLQQHPELPFNHFDWKLDFPEVLNPYLVNGKGGFNIVIGNPPWVSMTGKHGIEESKRNNLEALINKYKGNTSMPNLYEYFIKASFEILMKNGIFSFIIPDRFGFNVALSDLRKEVLVNKTILEIVYKWKFDAVIADTMTLIVKNITTNEYDFLIRTRPEYEPISVSKFEIFENSSLEFRGYDNAIIKTIVANIKSNSKPLNNYASVTSGFGGKSELITAQRQSKQQIEVVKGKSIKKYVINKKYYFDFRESNITGRTKDKNKLSKIEKVLLRKTGNSLIATYDNNGVFPEQSLYFLYDFRLNSKFILALLNSKLFNWYYQNRLVTNEDSTPQLKSFDLESFPIKTNKAVIQFQSLADFILFLRSKPLMNESYQLMPIYFEQIIDGMVYELYFPELLKKHNREIIKHLGELPEFTDGMSDEQKMKICKTVFDRLNDKEHPVKINLGKMKEEIKEIRIIEGLEN